MATLLPEGDEASTFCYVLLDSSFGTLSIVWRHTESGPAVWRVFLPQIGTSARDLVHGAFPGARPRSSDTMAGLAEQIRRFLDGEAVHFDLAILGLERCSDFQTRVLLAECEIP